MTEWLTAFLAGAVTGVLSGFGVGGGTLLLVYMTAFAGLDQRLAQGINLRDFLPAGLMALPSHWKNGFMEKAALLPAIGAGLACAAAAAWAATKAAVSHKSVPPMNTASTKGTSRPQLMVCQISPVPSAGLKWPSVWVKKPSNQSIKKPSNTLSTRKYSAEQAANPAVSSISSCKILATLLFNFIPHSPYSFDVPGALSQLFPQVPDVYRDGVVGFGIILVLPYLVEHFLRADHLTFVFQ